LFGRIFPVSEVRPRATPLLPESLNREDLLRRRAFAFCRFLTLSAIPLSFLHPAHPTLKHMLAPKRRQTIRRVINLKGTA